MKKMMHEYSCYCFWETGVLRIRSQFLLSPFRKGFSEGWSWYLSDILSQDHLFTVWVVLIAYVILAETCNHKGFSEGWSTYWLRQKGFSEGWTLRKVSDVLLKPRKGFSEGWSTYWLLSSGYRANSSAGGCLPSAPYPESPTKQRIDTGVQFVVSKSMRPWTLWKAPRNWI
jgi:hypothetical protein